MNWSRRYTIPAGQPEETAPDECGWPEVKKGLAGLLLGCLISVACAALAAGLLWLVITTAEAQAALVRPSGVKDGGLVTTVLFVGLGVLFLGSLGSYALILRGKWRCLMNAPERFGAKWFMFASILCIVVGPALNLTSTFLPHEEARQDPGVRQETFVRSVYDAVEGYRKSMEGRDLNAGLKLISHVSSLLSMVFFILFLRAVAHCFDDAWRVRMADSYLFFTGLLLGVSVVVLVNLGRARAHPQFLIGLAACWAISLIWYFVLVLNIIACISNYLEEQRRPRERVELLPAHLRPFTTESFTDL